MEQKAKTTKKVLTKKVDKAKDVKKTTKDAVTQKVISHRELKYKYPKGMINTLKRKSFRQQVRNKLRKFERDIAKAKGQDKVTLKKEFQAYYQETILNG